MTVPLGICTEKRGFEFIFVVACDYLTPLTPSFCAASIFNLCQKSLRILCSNPGFESFHYEKKLQKVHFRPGAGPVRQPPAYQLQKKQYSRVSWTGLASLILRPQNPQNPKPLHFFLRHVSTDKSFKFPLPFFRLGMFSRKAYA